MSRLSKITNTIVSCMLSLAAVAGGQVKAEDADYFHSNNYSFSIIFPEGWKVNETQFGGVQAVYKDGNGNESYITIHREEATPDHLKVLENNELADYRLLFWKEQGLQAKILEKGSGSIGRESGYWVESHVSGSFPQFETSYVIIKGGYLYTISTMVTPDDPSWYAKNKVLFKRAISSFEVK